MSHRKFTVGSKVGTYVTRDLSIYTYLRLQGHGMLYMKMYNNKVEFVFPTNNKLKKDVDNYLEDTATVNPKAFMKMYTVARQEMLAYMDNQNNHEPRNSRSFARALGEASENR